MKGLLVKSKDKISKAGIPQNGVGLVGNITWHSGASWSVGGLRVSDEMHLVWDGGMLEVGDVIEVEVAEFDEASAPVWEEKIAVRHERHRTIQIIRRNGSINWISTIG